LVLEDQYLQEALGDIKSLFRIYKKGTFRCLNFGMAQFHDVTISVAISCPLYRYLLFAMHFGRCSLLSINGYPLSNYSLLAVVLSKCRTTTSAVEESKKTTGAAKENQKQTALVVWPGVQ
jgi:hypothetical protein